MDFFYTKTADALLKSARKFISGRDSNYVFFKAENPLKQQRACTSIYVHIPFCNSLCPYCPYNRIPEDKARLALYIEALKKEITGISGLCGRRDVSSVYFGGGTPLLTGEKIKEITRTIRDNYNVSGDFCIEANPNDINEDSVELLKQAGFASISLGVQSFNDDLLKSIGRKYASSAAVSSAIKLLTSGFDSVNIDLLFALPGQNMDCLMNDLEKAVSLKPDQITTYPLFTFPYSEISQFKKIKHVESPSLIKRRRMYYSIYEYLEKSGYKRCSVWSFKREKNAKRYSSVTRERYLGFGASAGSYHETHFDLNTFYVDEYIKTIEKKGNAVAMRIKFTKRMAKLYDFYWRIYDTDFPDKRVLSGFSYEMKSDSILTPILKLMIYLQLAKRTKNGFSLTKQGSLWVHFAQNLLSLRAISRVWGEAKKNPWPEKIVF